jgi:hypothetical protein
MLRIPHCLNSRLTDGGKYVNLKRRPPLYSSDTLFFSAFGTHFCERLSKPQDLVQSGVFGKLKKITHLIGPQIRGLPACSEDLTTMLSHSLNLDS